MPTYSDIWKRDEEAFMEKEGLDVRPVETLSRGDSVIVLDQYGVGEPDWHISSERSVRYVTMVAGKGWVAYLDDGAEVSGDVVTWRQS